jgi:hypothetical protein
MKWIPLCQEAQKNGIEFKEKYFIPLESGHFWFIVLNLLKKQGD